LFSLDRYAMRAITAFLLVTAWLTNRCDASTRVDAALKRIDAAVHTYAAAHPREGYPSSMRELSAFAAARGTPLDLSPFTSIKIERKRRGFMSIVYHTHDPTQVYNAVVYSTIEIMAPTRSNQAMQRTAR
jgi:hypothetical protein